MVYCYLIPSHIDFMNILINIFLRGFNQFKVIVPVVGTLYQNTYLISKSDKEVSISDINIIGIAYLTVGTLFILPVHG